MPKKQHKETPEEQSARFRAEVEKLVAAGELSPTEAEGAVDRLVRRAATTKPSA
jgi:hypothetical protein